MARRLALLISVNTYRDPSFKNLNKATNDARGLAGVLVDPAIGGFELVENGPLIDKTRDEIATAIQDFFEDKQRDDVLLLFFAGHASIDSRGRLCFVANNTCGRRLQATAIDANFVLDLMNDSNAQKQIVILDCCYSGAFVPGSRSSNSLSRSDIVKTVEEFANPPEGVGKIVITATGSTQQAFEDEVPGKTTENSPYSIFSKALIDGLKTGDADEDNDGWVTHTELFSYIKQHIELRTNRQTPHMSSYSSTGDLIIARNPRPAPKPVVSPRYPSGYEFLDMQPNGVHLLRRKRDRQQVLGLFPDLWSRSGEKNGQSADSDAHDDSGFLIDQHLVTNAQYAEFLNLPEIQKQTHFLTGAYEGVLANSNNQRLVGDAQVLAQKKRAFRLTPDRIWGLFYYKGRWEPVPQTEELPVTLVSALGASWYSAWVNGVPTDQLIYVQSGAWLPTEAQWRRAGFWDPDQHEWRIYPWGNNWDRAYLNTASYWAGRELVGSRDLEEFYKNSSIDRKPRPTPVTFFSNGASACHMFDALGNVCEWLADTNVEGSHLIQGGSCGSAMDALTERIYRQADNGTEMIGFRCCRPS